VPSNGNPIPAPSTDQVHAALSAIQDPDLGRDVVQSFRQLPAINVR
jgi:hypothetical protein